MLYVKSIVQSFCVLISNRAHWITWRHCQSMLWNHTSLLKATLLDRSVSDQYQCILSCASVRIGRCCTWIASAPDPWRSVDVRCCGLMPGLANLRRTLREFTLFTSFLDSLINKWTSAEHRVFHSWPEEGRVGPVGSPNEKRCCCSLRNILPRYGWIII